MKSLLSTEFPIWSSTAHLLVTDRLGEAEHLLREVLREIDDACSGFRPDSELSRLHRATGHTVAVGPVLGEALAVALRAARISGGLVDPTVVADAPAPGWHRIVLDHARGEVLLPHGVTVDLGATAKALAADHAAQSIAARTGSGVLVSLGGDIAVAGPTPPGGWRIAVGDDHRLAVRAPQTTVTIHDGALATSSTTCRTQRDRAEHHIIDPRTGRAADIVWRTVSVAAATCVDANIASTAAIVLGAEAPDWLTRQGLPARLVASGGEVRTVSGWPGERQAA